MIGKALKFVKKRKVRRFSYKFINNFKNLSNAEFFPNFGHLGMLKSLNTYVTAKKFAMYLGKVKNDVL